VIASELVTNAVVDGQSPIELTVEHRDGLVTIAVSNGDPDVSEPRFEALDGGGYGASSLYVVASLADQCGVRATDTGKVVWANVRTSEA
jgi:hypothetical protein